MFRKYFVNNIALVSLAFLLFGCATAKTYHLYEGDPLPASEIATIKPWLEKRFIPLGSMNVWPVSIDGQLTELYSGPPPSYFVIPGEHKIKIGFSFYHDYKRLGGQSPEELLFTAEPGHLYLTKVNMPKAKELVEDQGKIQVKIGFWIEDANTQKVVAGTRFNTEE